MIFIKFEIIYYYKQYKMSKQFENLSSCIELCTIQYDREDNATEFIPNSFYYDTRLGMEIDEELMHPAYKECTVIEVLPVISVVNVSNSDYDFNIKIITYAVPADIRNKETKEVDIVVKYFPIDNSFIVRYYDPIKIIQAILSNNMYKDYFIKNDHPYYRYGYVADYGWAPENLTIMYNTMKKYNMESRHNSLRRTTKPKKDDTLNVTYEPTIAIYKNTPTDINTPDDIYKNISYEPESDNRIVNNELPTYAEPVQDLEEKIPKRYMFVDDDNVYDNSDKDSNHDGEVWTRVQEPDSNNDDSDEQEAEYTSEEEMTLEELKELEDLFGVLNKDDDRNEEDKYKEDNYEEDEYKEDDYKENKYKEVPKKKVKKLPVTKHRQILENEFIDDIKMQMREKSDRVNIYKELHKKTETTYSKNYPKLDERDDNL